MHTNHPSGCVSTLWFTDNAQQTPKQFQSFQQTQKQTPYFFDVEVCLWHPCGLLHLQLTRVAVKQKFHEVRKHTGAMTSQLNVRQTSQLNVKSETCQVGKHTGAMTGQLNIKAETHQSEMLSVKLETHQVRNHTGRLSLLMQLWEMTTPHYVRKHTGGMTGLLSERHTKHSEACSFLA